MNPLQLGASMTGLPSKKPTRRGRKKSGKPGADHLAKLQVAHGKGDHKAARRHALDYAKATRKMESPYAEANEGPVGAKEEMDEPMGAMNANDTPPLPKAAPKTSKAVLAALALKRMRK